MNTRFILVVMALSMFASTLPGQISNPTLSQPQKRIALVIGNSNYPTSTLVNPVNDARSMRDALKMIGFIVIEYENLSQTNLKKAIDDFGNKLQSNEVGLFYYAGHGIQSKGYNYLIPIDANMASEEDVEYDCVQADRVLAKMEASETKVNIIILDACRNNPFERSWTRSSSGKGLAFMNAPSGTLIAYATSPGNTASDGTGKNGLFTSAILESIKIPNITILEMFQNVRSIVSRKSGKQQIPWESTSLTGNFYFSRTDGKSENINGIATDELLNNNQSSLSEKNNNDQNSFPKQKEPFNDSNSKETATTDFDLRNNSGKVAITSENVLQKYIQAIGGEDILAKINDVTMSYSMDYEGAKSTITGTNIFKFPDKFVSETKINGKQASRTVVNGTVAKISDAAGKRNLSGEDLDNTKFTSELFPELKYAELGYKVEYKGIETINGNDSYHLIITSALGRKLNEYFSCSSGLKIRISSESNGIIVNIDIIEYSEINGIKFVKKEQVQTKNLIMTLLFNSIVINTGLNDTTFN